MGTPPVMGRPLGGYLGRSIVQEGAMEVTGECMKVWGTICLMGLRGIRSILVQEGHVVLGVRRVVNLHRV